MSSFLQRLAKSILAVGDWARRAWCRQQRQRLVGVTTTVLWAPLDEVPWALRRAEHRLFDADRAGRLLYRHSR